MRDCLVNFVSENNHYNLRNQNDYKIPFTRLQLYSNSFFPSTIRLWKSLDTSVRNLQNINSFKNRLRLDVVTAKPPNYYSVGNRQFNIIHTRLRHRCSNLNADLFRINFINDPSCACGWVIEDSIHYFLECCLYSESRQSLKDKLNFLDEIKIETLLFGDDSLSDNENDIIFKSVQQYIKQTKRFTNY